MHPDEETQTAEQPEEGPVAVDELTPEELDAYKRLEGAERGIAEIKDQIAELGGLVTQLATVVTSQQQQAPAAPTAKTKTSAIKVKDLPDNIFRFRSKFSDHVFWYRRREVNPLTGAIVLSRDQFPITFRDGVVDIDTLTDPDAEDKLTALRGNPLYNLDYFEDRKAQRVEGVVVLEGPKGTQHEPAEHTPAVDEAPLQADLV